MVDLFDQRAISAAERVHDGQVSRPYIPILPRFLVSLAHETTPIQSLFSIIIAELVWLILWPHGQLGCGSYSASQHFHHL